MSPREQSTQLPKSRPGLVVLESLLDAPIAGTVCYGALQANRQHTVYLLLRASSGQQSADLLPSVDAVPMAISYTMSKGQQQALVLVPGGSCPLLEVHR